ncbi:MAG TPA: helix-turn-helix domain-containing protein [Rhodospirillales bacterium]|nr:helix-turn-helix domain-containing protein [Rhodospirillales bacterium]
MNTTVRSRADVDQAKFDWTKADAATNEDIKRQIAEDEDTAPIFTEEELARARRVIPGDLSGDVAALRRRLGLTQREFAARYGFSIDTVANWEQRHREPRGSARVLLKVIANEPDAVTRALAKTSRGGQADSSSRRD